MSCGTLWQKREGFHWSRGLGKWGGNSILGQHQTSTTCSDKLQHCNRESNRILSVDLLKRAYFPVLSSSARDGRQHASHQAVLRVTSPEEQARSCPTPEPAPLPLSIESKKSQDYVLLQTSEHIPVSGGGEATATPPPPLPESYARPTPAFRLRGTPIAGDGVSEAS